MTRTFVLLGLGALLAATSADAHHSFAKTYSEEKQITLEGEVVSFEYRNPHAWVYFTASDESGMTRKYGAEWANPRRLQQQGVEATSLKAGDHVVVGGAPSRAANDYSMHLKSIQRPADGWTWPTGTGRRR